MNLTCNSSFSDHTLVSKDYTITVQKCFKESDCLMYLSAEDVNYNLLTWCFFFPLEGM